jgi:hypothetical protein
MPLVVVVGARCEGATYADAFPHQAEQLLSCQLILFQALDPSLARLIAFLCQRSNESVKVLIVNVYMSLGTMRLLACLQT